MVKNMKEAYSDPSGLSDGELKAEFKEVLIFLKENSWNVEGKWKDYILKLISELLIRRVIKW